MNFRAVFVIFRKELKDTLRDKRSFFISVIFPVILFPLIFSVLDMNIQKANSRIKNDIKIGLSESGETFIKDFLNTQGKFILVEEDNLKQKLISGEIYAYIKSDIKNGKRNIKITYDNSRQHSLTAASMLSELFNALEKTAQEKQPEVTPAFTVIQSGVYETGTGNSMLILSTLLPFLMFVFAALSPVALASDTGAGEKERYTLEPLLANPVSKSEILAGKYLCLIVMGLTGTAAFASGIIISTVLTPGIFGFEKLDIYINPSSAPLLFTAAVFLTMLFSSAELLLSLSARSPKEAQVLFLPLMMITMTAGYSTSIIDPLKIDTFYRHIPLLNISILIKEYSLNIISISSSLLTLSWTLFYISVFLLLSKFLISKESIVNRE